ncbi:TonB-dependent receptor domain-containing protein [Novosphingobium mangrovi (ex Hu et al. 2023)]|uniref:TonB-dependent receptor n=1 Tax=Novosphingobium mangrovi (ex Hu et al. 2023) TaxID=2930094 RepID=A0ABT0ADX8_9SPHN|nr:TonB-dependent receptor [Novosphingobium mangrovi (ex Hu et al. 2023)]MCJ1961403.1 TonB-dependent receptor [Novosphingobium mangrovi (ex Hu et al. 2023)]
MTQRNYIAAAIANVITRTGSATPEGEAQVTLGTTGLYRLDAFQSGPLSEDTYYAIGGSLRQNEGYRDSGFPADKGGQVRANIVHDFDNGSIKVSGQYTNDHNIFYLSIPTADPNDPARSLDRYLDYFTGTLDTDQLRAVNIRYRDGAGQTQVQTGDLANGRHIRFGNIGVDYEGDLGEWHVSAKAGYTQGKNHFDALYSTSNPVDANAFASRYLDAAQGAFGAGVTGLGYALAGTGGQTTYDPYADSGLVVSAQYRSIVSKFYSGQGDLSVTRPFDTSIGRHDVKLGAYGALYGASTFAAYQNYLLQVAGNPNVLDLAAYGAGGSVQGYVTNNGALQEAASLNGGNYDGQVVALYASDSWDLTDRLRIDMGLRHEWYSYDGYYRVTQVADLGDATTLADDATRAFTGAIVTSSPKVRATNWTVGVNYDLTDNFGVYGRASQLEVPANASVTTNASGSLASTKARLFEAGIKAGFGRSYLYVTGFYTKFDPLNASFTAFYPTTGRSDQTVSFVGTAENKGIEADGALHVAGPFSVSGSLTVQDPKYLDFANTAGADATAMPCARRTRCGGIWNVRACRCS